MHAPSDWATWQIFSGTAAAAGDPGHLGGGAFNEGLALRVSDRPPEERQELWVDARA